MLEKLQKSKTIIKKERAITLITLVITIILLIILAGVAINLAVGQNGLFKRAKEAKLSMQEATVKEIIQNIILEMQIDKLEKGGNLTLNQVAENLIIKDSNITLEEYTEEETQLKGTYNLNGEEYNFIINEKLEVEIIGKAEEKKVNIQEITWENGKAQVTLTSKEQGTIEYKDSDGTWKTFDNETKLENETTLTVRVKLPTGEITKEEQIEIRDKIKPTEFEIEVATNQIQSKAVTITLKSEPQDNETGLKEGYTYIAETNGSKIEKTNITGTTYKLTGLEPETNYTVYVIAYDNAGNYRESNKIKITTSVTAPPTIIGSSSTHIIHNLDEGEYNYTWEEIAEMAKIISTDNRNTITDTTIEVKIDIDGEIYILGVGDYKSVTYDGIAKQVRILGFNHDVLENGLNYNDGIEHTYAGISFEFLNLIIEDKVNDSNTNVNGWGKTILREKINREDTINKINIGNKIKKVAKEYNIGNYSKTNSICSDKLWLLACSEIWETYMDYTGWRGCYTNEGKQYAYYRFIGIKKLTDISNKEFKWFKC